MRSEIDAYVAAGGYTVELDSTLYKKFLLLEDPNLANIYIDSISLYDDAGNPVASIADGKGKTLTVKMNVVNASIITNISYFESVISLFSENSMNQARINTCNVSTTSNNNEIVVTIDVPANADSTWKLRAFIFDSLNNLRPLVQRFEFLN